MDNSADRASMNALQQQVARLENENTVLKASEAKLLSITATMPGVIYQFSVRGEVWTMDYISDRVYDIMGVSAAAIMADINVLIARVHPEDLPNFMTSVEAVIETLAPWHYEGRVIKPSGEIRWWQSSSIPTQNQEGTLVFNGFMSDVTDRHLLETSLQQANQILEVKVKERTKELEINISQLQVEINQRQQIEADLRESESRFQSLAANLPGMIYQLRQDVDGSFSFPYVSPFAKELYELAPASIQQDASLVFECMHPEETERLSALIAESAQNLQPWDYVGRIITPSGKLKWINAYSRPKRQSDGSVIWDGVTTDITSQLVAQEELRFASINIQTILKAAPLILFAIDAEGIFTFSQGKGLESMGLEQNAVVGQSVYELYKDVPEVLTNISLTLKGEEISNHQIQIGNFWFDSRYAPVFDAEGEVRGMVGVSVDITERKTTDLELRRFRQAVESSSDAIGISNPQGVHIYQNQAFSDLYGYLTPEEFRNAGGIAATFINPDIAQDIISDLGTGNSWAGEIEQKDKRGNILQTLIRAFPIKDSRGQIMGMVGVTTDISAQKEIESALRQQEALFRGFFEQAAVGIALVDLDWNFLDINEGFCQIVGYSKAELLRKGVADITYPEDIGTNFNHRQRLLDGEISHYSLEKRFIRSDGTLIWGNISSSLVRDTQGQPKYAVGVLEDISDRKLAEAKLRERVHQEALINQLGTQIRNSLELDIILQTAVQAVYALLDVDSCISAWYSSQPSSWHIYKEAKRDFLPSSLGIYPVDPQEPSVRMIQNQEMIFATDVAALPEGELRESLLRAGYRALVSLPIKTQSGKLGFLSVIQFQKPHQWNESELELLTAVRDQLVIAINQGELYSQSQAATFKAETQAQELEKALQELGSAQVRMIQTEKMSSLGQLVAGVAHEINNPVNFIYGNLTYVNEYADNLLRLLELYQQFYPQPVTAVQEEIEAIDLEFLIQDLPKMISSMKMGADRIKTIVASLRNFSRMDEAEMKDVDIHEGIESTLMILQSRIKATPDRPEVQVLKTYGQLPPVDCYAGQLNQVFMNILSNALDAMEEADQGRTKEYKQEHPNSIHISTELLPSNQVRISIKDNGIGIPKTVRQRIFDPFFTTKSVGKGTGMGLAISYQIITDRHNGTLECISQPGQGTEFVIQIPLNPSSVLT